VLANGTTREWLEAGAAEPDRVGLGLPADRFVWTYSGLSQDLGTAVSAAELLGDGFQLLIVGDGALRRRLEQWVARSPAAVVRFTGLVSAREAARYMRASDALLVSLAADPALGKSIPIKLYDCCAIGRPVVLAAPGEPRRIAEREQFAAVVDPGDPVALAGALRTLADDEALRRRLAAAARDFAGRHLRESQVDEMDGLLRQLSERR